MSNKILLTGATGFIGSRLAHALVQRGERIKVLVRPGSSLQGLRGLSEDAVQVVRGDILSEDDVFRALAGCDKLFHVAAVYKMYARDPEEVMAPSIAGTKNVLEAARKREQVEKIVVTSSVAAVGVNREPAPMDEDWTFNLSDSETYIVAKRRAEELALSYVDNHGLPLVVVNPAGVFGPGDWKPTPSGQSILQFLRWSWPWPMPISGGGLNVVDVDDVVSGHLLAMDKGHVGQRYILGGENLTFGDMFSKLAQVAGNVRSPGKPVSKSLAMRTARLMEFAARWSAYEPPFTYKLARDYIGNYVWVSSQKAEKQLGYEHRSALKTLERAVRWYEAHGYLDEGRSAA